jgi:hypothetical protein
LPLNTLAGGTALNSTDDMDETWLSGAACANGPDSAGRDVIYAFTTTTAGRYTVRVRPESGYDVPLALLRACAPLSCVSWENTRGAGGEEILSFDVTASTASTVVIDGYAGIRGAFDVGVEH